MNLTSLNYDPCTYQHNLKQSIGPSDYLLGTPRVECKACFPISVQMGSGYAGGSGGQYGGSVCDDNSLIDVSSELLNITRRASNCPNDKYIPYKQVCTPNKPLRDCLSIISEDTRISNPPCNNRCTGWNRWEWLCKDPQDKALISFDYNISNRIIVKDNHRPCIPNPISINPSLPVNNTNDDVYVGYQQCGEVNDFIPSVHWRKQNSFGNYLE